MSGANELTREDDIDVAGIFTSLKRKWWLILLVTLLTGALLVIGLSLISPRYESTARILVRDGDNTFTRTTSDANTQQMRPEFDEQAVRSEVEVLGSDKLVLEVIDDLDLTSLKEFKGEQDYLDVRSKVLELAGQTDRIEEPRRTPVETEKRNRTLRILTERLEVYAVERSRVLVVEFWANNAELAQMIVSALTEKYIKQKGNAKLEDSETATIWLDPRIRELENDVRNAEAAVAQFRAKADLLQTDNSNALLATQQLSQVSGELSRLKTERSSALSRAKSIKLALQNGSSIDVIPEVIDSPLIQRLREREVELRARISDLSTTLLPNHPRMRALDSQLGDFQTQIRSAANNIVKSLENNVQATLQAEASLEREIEELKKKAAKLDEKLVELRALEREADATKELLQEYKSRSLEAKSRSGLSQVDAEIISPATLADEAYFPKILPFSIAGMVAAMLLTVLAVIAIGLLSAVNAHNVQPAKREDPEMEEAGTDVNIIEEAEPADKERNQYKELETVLQRSKGQDTAEQSGEDLSDDNPDSATQDTRVRGEDGLKPHPVRVGAKVLAKISSAVVAVVSPGGDIGSSTSWILARKLVKMNRSVVLVDLSGGEISSRKLLGQKGLPGLFNLLSGSVRADQILYKDKASGVNVVPSGTLFSGTPAPDQEVLQEIVEAVASPFDFCIIDCGDAGVPDVEIIASDEAIIVISCIKATRLDVEELEEEFGNAGYSEVIRLAADRKDIAEKHMIDEAA